MNDSLRKGYSTQEIESLYALGRQFLDDGQLNKAELIFQGLTSISPDFVYPWLGISYVKLCNNKVDEALSAAKQALLVQASSTEALLLATTCLLSNEDYASAGAYLGEVQEQIEQGQVHDQYLINYFKAQLVRYEYRDSIA